MWQQQRLPSTVQSVAMYFGSSPSLIPLLLVHPRLPSFPSVSLVLLLPIIPGGGQAVRCDASCPDPADLHIPLRCPGTGAGSSSPGGCPEQVIMGCCHTQVHFKNSTRWLPALYQASKNTTTSISLDAVYCPRLPSAHLTPVFNLT